MTTPIILQATFNAFLLFFLFIRPSSKIGITNQMQRPIITDIIICFVCLWTDDSYATCP